jgi:hypothetical protein
VAKMFGPAISRLPAIFAGLGAGDEAAKARANGEALAAFGEVVAQCEPKAAAALVRDIVQVAQIKRPSGMYEHPDFNVDFRGKLGKAREIALWVLREQFGDLFPGAPANGRPAGTAGR